MKENLSKKGSGLRATVGVDYHQRGTKEERTTRKVTRLARDWNCKWLQNIMEIYNDNNEASFNRVLKVIQDWIDFVLVCSLIGPETRATLSTMPVWCKINTNHDLFARVFPLFRRFSCFYFEFSLGFQGICRSADKPLW